MGADELVSGARAQHNDVEKGATQEPQLDANTGIPSHMLHSEDTKADTSCAEDVEHRADRNEKNNPPFKALSILDRFLVIWIVLAMMIGILLGNLVPSTGPALQRGEFVGVSIPIGKAMRIANWFSNLITNKMPSGWTVGDDVSDSVQSPIRVTTLAFQA